MENARQAAHDALLHIAVQPAVEPRSDSPSRSTHACDLSCPPWLEVPTTTCDWIPVRLSTAFSTRARAARADARRRAVDDSRRLPVAGSRTDRQPPREAAHDRDGARQPERAGSRPPRPARAAVPAAATTASDGVRRTPLRIIALTISRFSTRDGHQGLGVGSQRLRIGVVFVLHDADNRVHVAVLLDQLPHTCANPSSPKYIPIQCSESRTRRPGRGRPRHR